MPISSLISRLKPKGKDKALAPSQTEGEESRGEERSVNVVAPREDYGLFTFGGGQASTIVDIVAVHGLDGDWERAWTDDNGKLWLRDFLPGQLPNARIMSYGYNSTTTFSKAVTDINDEAAMLLDRLNGERRREDEKMRPLIFVSHSLGGIVVKKAMILAHERSKEYGTLLKSVRGLIFFGVPHRGSDPAFWKYFVSNIVKVTQLGFGTNTNFVEALQKNSPILAEISDQFIERGEDILRIRTFFETDKIGNMLLVDRDSARLGLPNEIAVAIAGSNHCTICKFSDAESQKYKQVIRALEDMVELAVSDSGRTGEQSSHDEGALEKRLKPSMKIPYPRDPKFVGREDILRNVEEGLRTHQRLALVGLGGVGKTQIAIEYAHRTKQKFPETWVFWIHASNSARFVQGYREIGTTVKIPGLDDPKTDVLSLVCQWLRNEQNGRWLLIIDNADDSDIFFKPQAVVSGGNGENQPNPTLSSYLPHSPTGSILITSRHRKAAIELAEDHECVLSVELMTPEEANILAWKNIPHNLANETDCSALCKALEYIPLAITQASAYIAMQLMPVSKYLALFQRNESNQTSLLNKNIRDPRRDPSVPNSVITTWQITFEQIKRDKPTAADLISLMSVFDRQGIPEFLLSGDDSLEFEDAMGTLKAFSLVTANLDGQSFEMHRLVQISTREWLAQRGEVTRWRKDALDVLSGRFPTPSYQNWSICETLTPHVHVVIGYEYDDEPANLRRATLLSLSARYYEDRGIYSLAEEMNRRALEGYDKALGPDHPYMLASVGNLARVLRYQGKYEAAEEMNRRALEGIEKALGPDHPYTLSSVSNLATVLRAQGKYEAAEEMNRRALEGIEKALGPDHPDTLTSVNNLATVLRAQGKYEAAEEMTRRALEGSEKALGPDHPDTLISVNNLAMVLQDQGKYEAAEEMNRRTLEGREKALGPEHPDTLISVNNLAMVLQDQGKYEAAEEMNRRALEGREKALGPEHPSTLISVNNLAMVLRAQGKYEAAEEMNRRTLEGREKALGPEHPDTLISVNNLATVLRAQGKYEAVEEMNRRALEGREKALGPEHPSTLISVNNLAMVLQDQGKYEAAEEMNRRALEGSEKVLGPEHPDTLGSVYCLAYLLHGLKRWDEAIPLYERAREGYEKCLGSAHPYTQACIKGYSNLLEEMKAVD